MDTFDSILLSYDKSLITDDDFLFLCRSYISQNLDLFSAAFRTACNSNHKTTLIESSLLRRDLNVRFINPLCQMFAGAKSNGSIRRRTSARCMPISYTSLSFSRPGPDGPDHYKLIRHEPAIYSKTSAWSAVNFQKAPEPHSGQTGRACAVSPKTFAQQSLKLIKGVSF